MYPKTNEVFVAEGYGNRRVIVFEADTGAYKRHWGDYRKVHIFNRETFQVVGFFGGYGGHGTGQFYHLHSIATDSKGSVYVVESFGERALRWNLKSR